VTAREREEPDDRPTKAMILRQIQDYLTNDVVDEAEVVKLMEGPKAAWQWSAKPGMIAALKVVGKSGRVQLETNVVVKEISEDEIILKYEGDGKVGVLG